MAEIEILKFIQNIRRPGLIKTILKNNKTGKTHTFQFQNSLQATVTKPHGTHMKTET